VLFIKFAHACAKLANGTFRPLGNKKAITQSQAML
jgi:hypothetical protein